jgi:hypothetical protein
MAGFCSGVKSKSEKLAGYKIFAGFAQAKMGYIPVEKSLDSATKVL